MAFLSSDVHTVLQKVPTDRANNDVLTKVGSRRLDPVPEQGARWLIRLRHTMVDPTEPFCVGLQARQSLAFIE